MGRTRSLRSLRTSSLTTQSHRGRSTPAEVTKGLSQAQKIKMHIVPYHGLGMTAYYYSFTETGITIQGISGTQGVKEYGAAVYTKTTPKSTLASLVQLAEKL